MSAVDPAATIAPSAPLIVFDDDNLANSRDLRITMVVFMYLAACIAVAALAMSSEETAFRYQLAAFVAAMVAMVCAVIEAHRARKHAVVCSGLTLGVLGALAIVSPIVLGDGRAGPEAAGAAGLMAGAAVLFTIMLWEKETDEDDQCSPCPTCHAERPCPACPRSGEPYQHYHAADGTTYVV